MVTFKGSKLPDVLDELIALLTAQLSPNDILVKDAQWTSEEAQNDIISVGWSGFIPGYEFPSHSMSEELGGVNSSSEMISEGLGPSLREVMHISCASICRLGDSANNETVSANRRRTYGNITLVGNTVLMPPFFPGVVAKCTMGSASQLHQVADSRGLLCIVTFSIECEAYVQ